MYDYPPPTGDRTPAARTQAQALNEAEPWGFVKKAETGIAQMGEAAAQPKAKLRHPMMGVSNVGDIGEPEEDPGTDPTY